MNYPLIYIEWCDAMHNNDAWLTEKEIIEWADNEDWIVCQVGWVVKETKEYLLLSAKLCISDKDNPILGQPIKIPTTWIRKKIDLSEKIIDNIK